MLAERLGAHTIAFHSYKLERAVREIAALGYCGIELNAETNWALPHVTPQTPVEERRRYSSLIREHGLTVSSVCAHTPLIYEGERGTASLEFMKGCIDIAAEFHAGVVHAISGALERGASAPRAWELLSGRVAQLVDYSRSRGIKFAFEAAVNQLVATSSHVKELTLALGNERLFINFDPSHPVLYGEDPAELIREYGSRIVHVHAKDSRGQPNKFEFPPLGKGVIDFRKFFDALAGIGYHGYVSVEYEGEPFGYERDPVVALRSARAFLEKLH